MIPRLVVQCGTGQKVMAAYAAEDHDALENFYFQE